MGDGSGLLAPLEVLGRCPVVKRRGTRTGRYRSKFEAAVAPALEARGFTYEATRVAYAREPGIYIPDFVRGRTWVEVKGYLTPADRRKMLQVRADYPHADIVFLFQNPRNTISPRSRTTYAAWAERHGFRVAASDRDL